MIIRLLILLLLMPLYVFGEQLKTLTADEYIAANPSPERKSIIGSLMQQFENKSITQAELDELWEDKEVREALGLIRVQIIKQKLYIKGVDETYPYFRSYAQYFQKLITKYKIPDLDFIIYPWDQLDMEQDYINKLVKIPSFMAFKNQADVNEAKMLILPDAAFLWDSYAVLLNKIKQAYLVYSWQNKSNKYYWRGSTTGNAVSPYNLQNFSKLPRLSLVMMSKLYPNIIDARFTYFTDEVDPQVKKLMNILFGNILEKVPEIEHLQYKYLLSIDGHSATGTRVPWIMYSNSVLVKQDSHKIEWFYSALRPYVHYIPLKHDLTDIFKQFEWMKSHDQEVQKISINAHNFIQNELMPEHIEAHMVIILNKYAEIQKDKELKISLPPVEETRSIKGQAIAVLKRIKRNFSHWIRTYD